MDNWSQVHDQYGSLVWATVYRILGDHADSLDCCQDVFAEAAQRSSARAVREWPAFLRWLATRRALDRLRKRRVEAARIDADGDLATVSSTTLRPDDQAAWHELMERLRQALAQLPEHQDEVFWLRTICEMSYEEIAEQLGMDVNHVGVLLHRARQNLRQRLAYLNPLNHPSD
jgi:RNA polymerase sigma-70 factor (ECF subfamily)